MVITGDLRFPLLIEANATQAGGGHPWVRAARGEGAFCDGGHSLVDDFMWVSVLRLAPGEQGIGHCDGHCHGFTARQAHPHLYDAIIPNSSRCAFFRLIQAVANGGSASHV
tara:strand:- start:157 stop:489 length:333 start_codon:yes stop_codon:yes gene_type:complete